MNEAQPQERHEQEAGVRPEAHDHGSGDETAEQTRDDPPRIYAASLSDYNAGRLYGAWIDAARDPDELHEDIAAMLAASPTPGAEEWAIHDYDGFNGLHLGEWENLEYVSVIAKGIAAHGLAFAHWAQLVNGVEELARFTEAYRGHWPSVEAYAEHLLEEVGAEAELEGLSPWLEPYLSLDIAGFARDLRLGDDIWTARDEAGVHVFDPI